MKTFKQVGFVLTCLATFALSAPNAGAWGRFEGGHHPSYGGAWARPNPVVVHRTYVEHARTGCVGCGVGVAAVAGLIGGAILGAAIAGNAPPPAPTYYGAPPPSEPLMVAGPPIGSQVAMLPPGCGQMNVNGATLYQCGPIWYQPFFGGNGVYYTVVPAP